MKIIYTNSVCPRCEDLKASYRVQGIPFKERSAERLKGGCGEPDKYDIEARARLAMQNEVLPVEVSTDDEQSP